MSTPYSLIEVTRSTRIHAEGDIQHSVVILMFISYDLSMLMNMNIITRGAIPDIMLLYSSASEIIGIILDLSFLTNILL